MGDLNSDAVAVVLGGNQGIGSAVAASFAERGLRVVISGRNVDRLESTAREIMDRGGTVAWYPLDINDIPQIRDVAHRIGNDVGRPAILVNAVGNSLKKPAFDVTVDDWEFVINTHLRGAFFASQAFAELMAEDGYGKIVNLSSTWASTVAPERSLYATAKAGVSHMTAALAVEWAPLGIRVNAVAPTATRTPRVQARHEANPDSMRFSLDRIPLGRLAEPMDVVAAVDFLASKDSDFVTGHTLYVDGGWRFSK